MIYQSEYGYKIDFGDLSHDVYIINEKNQIVAAFKPHEFLEIKRKIIEIIIKESPPES